MSKPKDLPISQLIANLSSKIELDCEILKSIFIQKHDIFKNIHQIN